MEFSESAMHRLIKNQCDRSVSCSASNELGEILEQFAGFVAEEAIELAKEGGYQTVQGKHIRNAILD